MPDNEQENRKLTQPFHINTSKQEVDRNNNDQLMMKMIQSIRIDWERLENYRISNDWLSQVRKECTNFDDLVERYKPNWYYTQLLKEQITTALLGHLHLIGLNY